jgi:hypothetical protein
MAQPVDSLRRSFQGLSLGGEQEPKKTNVRFPREMIPLIASFVSDEDVSAFPCIARCFRTDIVLKALFSCDRMDFISRNYIDFEKLPTSVRFLRVVGITDERIRTCVSRFRHLEYLLLSTQHVRLRDEDAALSDHENDFNDYGHEQDQDRVADSEDRGSNRGVGAVNGNPVENVQEQKGMDVVDMDIAEQKGMDVAERNEDVLQSIFKLQHLRSLSLGWFPPLHLGTLSIPQQLHSLALLETDICVPRECLDVVQKCTSLSVLKMQNSGKQSKDYPIHFIAQLPSLTWLELENMQSMTDEDFDALTSCKALEKLSLPSFTISLEKRWMLLNRLQKLRSLTLRSLALPQSTSGCNLQELQELHLKQCREMDDGTYQALGQFPNLENLFLMASKISQVALQGLLQLGNLNCLHIGSIDPKAIPLLSSFRTLEYLTVNNCQNFKDNEYAEILTIEDVRKLTLKQCWKLNDTTFLKATREATIEFLSIQGSQVTGEAIALLFERQTSIEEIEVDDKNYEKAISPEGVPSDERCELRPPNGSFQQLSCNQLARIAQFVGEKRLFCSLSRTCAEGGNWFMKEFDIQPSLANKGDVALLYRLRYVERLRIRYNNWATDERLQVVGNLSHLKYLSMSVHQDATEKGFFKLCKLTKLEGISLSGCNRLQNKMLQTLINCMPHLTHLRLTDCEKITKEVFNGLKKDRRFKTWIIEGSKEITQADLLPFLR